MTTVASINKNRFALEVVKRFPSVKASLLNSKVRIYSGEWKMYWRPTAAGYTEKASEAWVTSFENAMDHSSHSDSSKKILFEVVE